ncbi:Rrf2 family transcriptional regulator [Marinobacter sp. chi1]|uniref:Rrf2 family transcriptional regulator n=1 Tax=Marinobacter suaedae TaxID=3057675 RepID=A0ABT8VXQ5_9GAMM|nr:Rrf2 family transcriptional regulator [Marinobacter sp. chi1]MDO3720731.1 Rrf2 family transcriptional regulator [Marinobacter sp. chi1]
MHITRYTDYSLRVLIYLAVQKSRLVTIQEIANQYDISRNHLMKVVHQLNRHGYIETVRGKKGGMRLNMEPPDVNIGVLVRETEQDLKMVECFAPKTACRIAPVCGLKPMFAEALQAFLDVLDNYTLADVIQDHHRPQLLRLLHVA